MATGRGRTAGEGSGARGGSGSGEGCAPTEARTGPPGKRARDPTATSMRAVPRRPGRQPASAPLAGPPPSANQAPPRLGPKPHVTPAAGAHLNLRPSVRSIPESRPRGKQPPGESGPTRAHTPPPVATRDGSGRETAARAARGGGTRGGAPPLGRHGTARERPHAHAHARTRTHARAPRTGRRPGPAGSSPDSEGGGAGRGRQRAVLSPTAGPADPSRRGGSAQHATVVTPHRWPLHAEEGPQLGVSSTPRHPLGSLEKAFSPRVHRPHPFVPRPGPTKRRPKGRQGLGGGGRSAARGRHRAILSAHSRGPTKEAVLAPPHTPRSHLRRERASCLPRGHKRRRQTRHAAGQRNDTPRLAKHHSAGSARCDRSHAPPRPGPPPAAQHAPGGRRGARNPMGGGGRVGLPYRLHRPLLGLRHQQAVARGGRWEQGTTPPLGLRHLGRPGALQGHHGGPGATRSARPGGEQRGVGTALPMAGRAAHHTEPRKASESVRCVRGPRSHGRQEAERGRAGSGRSPHPSPRALPAPPQRAEEEEEAEEQGARGQNKKSGPIRHECPSLV